jgi:peptide/nickel transport system substrate-binding protein
MNKSLFLSSLFAVTLFTAGISGCKNKSKDAAKGTVVYREASDCDNLNPINLSSANGRVIADFIFGALVDMDRLTLEFAPSIAKSMPVTTEVTEGEFKGGMRMEFEIYNEATWDDGKPVTVHDYIFTLKSILNPKTNCENLKPYFEWVGDVMIDTTNLKKVVVFSKEKYFAVAEAATGYVLPEHLYDPSMLMRKFSLRDLNNKAKKSDLKGNADILKFAEEFNSEKFQRDPKFVSGCWAYALDHWTTGQELVLKRKKDWWGDKVKDNKFLVAYPEKIVFKVIKDNNTAHTALKDNKLDAFEAIDAKRFKELEANEGVVKNYTLKRNPLLTYTYLGFNMRNIKFKDLKVRQAIAQCVDRDKINEVLSYNEREKAISFVHPSQKDQFNSNIKQVEFNPENSKKLLAEAGWKDTDGDGFLDKVINGKVTKFEIDFKTIAGSDVTKQTVLMLKENFNKVGLELNIIEKEFSVYLEEIHKFEFEMNIGAWTISAQNADPKQIWHTSSAVEGGSNYVGFGNSKSDKVIDGMRAELDPAKRAALLRELQQMIVDEQPIVYMFYPVNRMAVSKKFDVKFSMRDPGFHLNEFKAAE